MNKINISAFRLFVILTFSCFFLTGCKFKPNASFTISPEVAEEMETIVFDASASFAFPDQIHSYSWDFGDGRPEVYNDLPEIDYFYPNAGEYTVTLTVTSDEFEKSEAAKTITIIKMSNYPPQASFIASPSIASVNETISFDASASSDEEGGITSYSWDFGDGESGAGSIITHSYGAKGEYPVTLIVGDSGGKISRASVFVVINN